MQQRRGWVSAGSILAIAGLAAAALMLPISGAQASCPLSFTATPTSSGTVAFHWSGFGGADGYQVYGHQGQGNTAGYSPMLTGDARDYTRSNLASGNYTFWVAAYHSGTVAAESCQRDAQVYPGVVVMKADSDGTNSCPITVTATQIPSATAQIDAYMLTGGSAPENHVFSGVFNGTADGTGTYSYVVRFLTDGGSGGSYHADATWGQGRAESPTFYSLCFGGDTTPSPGNEWWVQTSAYANQPIAKVQASINGAPWQALDKMSWGNGVYAKSIHAPQGSLVRFEILNATGDLALNPFCYQWTNATLILNPCPAAPGSAPPPPPPPPAPYTATFGGVQGNEWWVQAQVMPVSDALSKVEVRLNSGPWQTMKLQSWGTNEYATSIHIVDKTSVQLQATTTTGAVVDSGCYLWIPASGQTASQILCGGTPPPPPLPKQCSLDASIMSCAIHCDAGDNLHMQAHDTLQDGTGYPRIHVKCGSVDTYCQANNDCSQDVITSSGGDGSCYLETSRTTGSCSAGAPPPPQPAPSAVSYYGVKGNEWWIEAHSSSKAPVAGLDARVDGGTWTPMTMRSWGAWAVSMHAPTGSHVQFRARTSDGSYMFGPNGWTWTAANEYPTSGPSFNPVFANVKGNANWVQANVYAPSSWGLQSVAARVNSGPWQSIVRQTYGDWAAAISVPSGAVVQFEACAATCQTSGQYTWPAATSP